MSAYVRAADAIRDALECAVVIVHHCGIEGTRPRGHTSLSGALDAQIAVWRDAEDNVVSELELAKDGPQGDKIVSRLEVVNVGVDEDGDNVTSCVVVEGTAVKHSAQAGPRLTPNQQTMLSILREGGPLTSEQWNEKGRAAGIGTKRKATLYDAQVALRSKGLVHQSELGFWSIVLWPGAASPTPDFGQGA
jgi:hypothetical protein